MNKQEEPANNQKKTKRTSRGKKKGLTPHHFKKQIRLNNLYYTIHQEELETILQELNTELSKAGITLTADEYTYLNIDIDQDKMTVLTTRKAGRKKSQVYSTNRSWNMQRPIPLWRLPNGLGSPGRHITGS